MSFPSLRSFVPGFQKRPQPSQGRLFHFPYSLKPPDSSLDLDRVAQRLRRQRHWRRRADGDGGVLTRAAGLTKQLVELEAGRVDRRREADVDEAPAGR